ncbi:flagellar basal body-associated FliL family protein [Gorillibacterium sp. sgz5001074]|uniref:flagellar basal body-associated FliL family protein n=1 Tax=Gorillibacterium sp. sgz5001074 TaxID=3446695 RepID=UPI003F66A263
MFKNKFFMIIMAMLIVITLILVAFFALWHIMDKNSKPADPNEAARSSVSQVDAKKLTPAEVKALTVFVKDVVTNLADKGRIVKASFAFEMDNKKGKEEFETLDFKAKGIILQTLADMKAEQIQGSKGQEYLVSTLMNKINSILTEGKIKQISITDYYVE